MSPEVTLLAWSMVLGLVHIVLSSHAKSLQHGYRWSAGPRDGDKPPLAPLPGQLERALGNFRESFPLFAAAILAAEVLGIRNALTWWGAASLLLGTAGLRASLRLRHPHHAVPRLERGDGRHHPDPCRHPARRLRDAVSGAARCIWRGC